MNENKIKGLSVTKLSIVLIIIGIISFTVAILCSVEVAISYSKVNTITNDYIRTQGDIYSLQAASDYLSSKSRQYVMTGEDIFAIEYFEEVNETKRRDKAVENIKDAVKEVGYGESANIEKALRQSNFLMEREVYAMSLIASMSGGKHVPAELTSYVLSDSDKALTPEEKREKAYSLVFGTAYSEEKLSIRDSVDGATDSLLGDLDKYKSVCSDNYSRAFALMLIFLGTSAVTFGVIAICLFVFVLNPLSHSVKAINGEQLIPYSKSFELNYLAVTYNKVYEDNATTRLHLKNKAERDELTGLLNRSAFNSLVDFYKNAEESLAFLIIDVDKFKTVNDTYGHQIGDEALKKVASLLDECFRSNDFPARYGGDEFAVIMTEITHSQKGVIERKLNYINDSLQNDYPEGFPKLSISVGVAFSEHGFADDLIENADKALYTTKKNGRCGYTFHEK